MIITLQNHDYEIKIKFTSSDGADMDYPTSVQRDWIVAQNPYGYWTVYSTEKLDAVINNSRPYHGEFTGITHLSSSISASEGYSWQQGGASTSFAPYIATANVSGTVIAFGAGLVFIPTTTKQFFFPDVF